MSKPVYDDPTPPIMQKLFSQAKAMGVDEYFWEELLERRGALEEVVRFAKKRFYPLFRLLPNMVRDMTKERDWQQKFHVPENNVEFHLPVIVKMNPLPKRGLMICALAQLPPLKTKIPNQLHAEALLRNQEEIPKSWQGRDLLFLGTVWESFGEKKYIPFLHFVRGEWHLDFIQTSTPVTAQDAVMALRE